MQERPVSLPPDFDGTYPCVRMRKNSWNDYGFETTFQAMLCPTEDTDTWIDLGGVKIGRFGYTTDDPSMRSIFNGTMSSLPDNYFSLGQLPAYYDDLAQTSPEVRNAYAAAMRDIAMTTIDAEALEQEDVYRISILRTSRALQALDHGRALFGTQAVLVERFEFRATIGQNGDHVVPFDFRSTQGLPHRVNVLVGVNGVGKTQLPATIIPAWTTLDANLSYVFPPNRGGALAGSRISLNVTNLTDRSPPIVLSGTAGFDAANANPNGRMWTIEISHKF